MSRPPCTALVILLMLTTLSLPSTSLADTQATFGPPYEDPFVNDWCAIGALPGTCRPDGDSDAGNGILYTHSETVSPLEGSLPGGSRVQVDAGFFLTPELNISASSVTFDIDYTIHHAALATAGGTHGWASGVVIVAAWVGHDGCDCFSRADAQLLKLGTGPSEVTNQAGSLPVVLRSRDSSIRTGEMTVEVRVIAIVSLLHPWLQVVGDTGRAVAYAEVAIDRVRMSVICP